MANILKANQTLSRDILLFAVLCFIDRSLTGASNAVSGAYCNPSGPWSLPISVGMMIILATFSLVGLIFAYVQAHFESTRLFFVFIMAGGFCNLLDRILLGCVRDFRLISWFPAFNVSDVMITVGVMLLLYSVYVRKINGGV
jgi:hypothetical protein